MKNYLDFCKHLLTEAKPGLFPNGEFANIQVGLEANNFQVRDDQICLWMTEMHRRGLILLHVYDGLRECALEEWLNSGGSEFGFYHCGANSQYVKVRLTTLGQEERDRLRKGLIGFAAQR